MRDSFAIMINKLLPYKIPHKHDNIKTNSFLALTILSIKLIDLLPYFIRLSKSVWYISGFNKLGKNVQ